MTAVLAPCALAQAMSGAVSVVPVINTYVGNGSAISVALNSPATVALDNAGNLYISDTDNSIVRKVTASTGMISTVAGNGTPGYAGDGGAATSAALSQPEGVAVDSAGNLYIADAGNNVIRKVTASAGTISTVAGTPSISGYKGDGGSATSAILHDPYGVAVDSAGNIYIADWNNQRIRMVAAANETMFGQSMAAGDIYTVAGNGSYGYNGDGIAAISAELNSPVGVAVDSTGNLYIVDRLNLRIRVVAAANETMFGQSMAAGDIYTVAGNGSIGYSGDGGVAISAALNFPQGVAVDGAGNIYIADTDNNIIRKVTVSTGIISTVAGTQGLSGYSGDGGQATSAVLNQPEGAAVDNSGNIYLADTLNNRIRKVSSNVALPTTAVGAIAASQSILVQLTAASVVSSITVPKAQNGAQEFTVGVVTGCDTTGTSTNAVGTICTVPITFKPQYPGQRTEAVTLNDGSSIVGTVGLVGNGTGPMGVFQPGTASVFTPVAFPYGVAVDDAGDVYFISCCNALKVTPGGVASDLSTGSLTLRDMEGIAVDGAGDVYLADTGNNRVVKVTAAGAASVLNTGSLTLNMPYGVAVDGAGDVYIADYLNYRVVKVTTAGVASIFNATGSAPTSVAVDGAGDVYIADFSSVEKVAVNGAVSVLSTGSLTLDDIEGIAVDGAGDVYVSDYFNNRVVEVAANGPVSVLSTGGLSLSFPNGAAVDGAGDVYISDHLNSRVVEVNQGTAPPLTFASTAIGQTSTDSPQTVTVQNIGNQTLDLTALAATTNFNLNGSTTCTSTTILPPGATCGLGVEFEPTVAGNLTGTVNITDNNLNALAPNYDVQQVGLNGTGTIPVATTTTLAVSATSAAYGAGVTLTATVMEGSSPATTGTVTFYNGSTSIGTGTLNSSGVTKMVTYDLSTGADSLTASFPYEAQGNYAASTSAATTVTITAATTTAALTASATSAAYGASVVLTATVNSGGSPVTSGTVSFLNNGISIGTATVNSSGVATLTTMTLPVGTAAITTSYAAQGNYAASTSATTTVTITAAVLTVTANNATRVYGTANPSFTGTFTGAVNGNSFVETFSTTATTTSPVAGYAIVPAVTGTSLADYAETLVNGSLSVTKAGSSMVLVPSATSINADQSLTLTATVTSATTGAPTGTVTFLNGTTSLGTGILNAQGVATLTITTLGAGTDSLTAQYGGDTNFTSSTSLAITETIVAPGVTTAPTAPSLTVAPGASVTDTLAVAPVGGYSGALSFSCTGLPQGVTCSFQPATLTVSATSAAQNVTVTIQTTGAATAELRPAEPTMPSNHQPVIPTAVFWAPGWLLAALASGKRKLPSRVKSLLALLLLIGGIGMMTACGGGGGSSSAPPVLVTPAGTSTMQVLVTGTGGVSQSISLGLTVQ